MAELHTAVDAMGENRLDPGDLLAAPPKVREARIALDSLVERYQTLRRAHDLISAGSPAVVDHNGLFSEMSNATVFWKPKLLSHTPPWPSEPLERIVWMIRRGAHLWCPTGTERDAAYLEAYPSAAVSESDRARIDAAA